MVKNIWLPRRHPAPNPLRLRLANLSSNPSPEPSYGKWKQWNAQISNFLLIPILHLGPGQRGESLCGSAKKQPFVFSCETETGTFSPVEARERWHQKEACFTRDRSKRMLFFLSWEIQKDTDTHLLKENRYAFPCRETTHKYFLLHFSGKKKWSWPWLY